MENEQIIENAEINTFQNIKNKYNEHKHIVGGDYGVGTILGAEAIMRANLIGQGVGYYLDSSPHIAGALMSTMVITGMATIDGKIKSGEVTKGFTNTGIFGLNIGDKIKNEHERKANLTQRIVTLGSIGLIAADLIQKEKTGTSFLEVFGNLEVAARCTMFGLPALSQLALYNKYK